MARAAVVVIVVWVSGYAGGAAAQDPAERGGLAIEEWDAGTVSAGGASLPTVVVYPSGEPGPFPVVGVIHGLNGLGSMYMELARTLASHGLVAVVPDMPCRLGVGCDHAANA